MSKEFYKRFRPRNLKGVVGQESAIAILEGLIEKDKVPHVLILSGPSGCGKTTIARILKTTLDCGDADFQEVNAADTRGIDTVREIRKHMGLRPISGECRIWLIDEAHKLTNDAQNGLLKILEDTPKHVYFMLCTTDPQKLIRTIHTRGTELKLKGVVPLAMEKLLCDIIEREKLSVGEDVVASVIDAAEGSARKALVILEQVSGLDGDKAQLAAVASTTYTRELAFDLARLLVTGQNIGWADVAKILRAIKEEDAEGIRYCIIGYARSCMVGGEGKPPNIKLGERAFKIIDIFGRNFFDSKHAGLAAACWEAVFK